MKVNMTPNPLDVVTIHASQGDTEARQWEFELHNNGELIDTSDVKEQMFFKAYKGGTEEILPTNGSTPTTSPFKGDIKYPQGLLSDQEFLYRESPTEEDGLAKITDIKGNTLNWNQLVQNGNFADGLTNWTQANATLSVSNGVCRATLTGGTWNNDIRQTMTIVNGHKYLLSFDYLTSTDLRELAFTTFGNIIAIDFRFSSSTTKKHHSAIYTATADYTGIVRFTMRSDGSSMSGQYYEVSNVNLFDLTQMGLDITDPSDFTSLFPLPYYAYNQGTLLSFMGNGIKTVGKNQCNADDVQVGKAWNNTSNSARAVLFAPIRPNTQYTVSITSLGTVEAVFIVEESEIGIGNGISAVLNNATKSFTFTSKSDSKYIALQCNKTAITKSDFESVKFMVEHGATASSYEPYTSSTLSLPISTYFPSGMDGVGTDYDELTNTKATTRMATITLDGTQEPSIANWRATSSSVGVLFPYSLTNNKTFGDSAIPNVRATENVCSYYDSYAGTNDKSVALYTNTNYGIMLRLPDTSLTTKALVMSYLAQNPIMVCYPMATPIETSFTTASLVTENAEIPLSNEDGVLIGKCTEQLSENPGFIDAKIKLADEDGECYSNKIQLHIERSPQ